MSQLCIVSLTVHVWIMVVALFCAYPSRCAFESLQNLKSYVVLDSAHLCICIYRPITRCVCSIGHLCTCLGCRFRGVGPSLAAERTDLSSRLVGLRFSLTPVLAVQVSLLLPGRLLQLQ